jgi:hypothetical protein
MRDLSFSNADQVATMYSARSCQKFTLEDAIGLHACIQPIQQWVTELMVSARGCNWIPCLFA